MYRHTCEIIVTRHNLMHLFYHTPGDPSIFGNLEPHPAVKKALRAVLDSSEAKINGYPHSAGLVEAREAIAQMSSSDNCKLTHEVLPLLLNIIKGISPQFLNIFHRGNYVSCGYVACQLYHNIGIFLIAHGDNIVFLCVH